MRYGSCITVSGTKFKNQELQKKSAGAAPDLTCSLINPTAESKNSDNEGASITKKLVQSFFGPDKYRIEIKEHRMSKASILLTIKFIVLETSEQ